MDISKDPKANITHQFVEKALHNDFGPDAVLKSFQIKDFVNPGEGFIAKVTSVITRYYFNEQERTVTYIAKLRPSFPMLGFQEFATEVCDKEAYFLTEVSPELDKCLKGVKVSPLNVPVCVLNELDGMKSVFFMKDVREQNFKKSICQNVLDKEHASLTLRELAKLHATGYILKQGKQLLDRFPKLEEKWYAQNTFSRQDFNHILTGGLRDLTELLSDDTRYASAIQYAKAIMKDPVQIIEEALLNIREKFKTICHGDPKADNLMFRYSDTGSPQEVILLDLQLARVASIASDLTYFFFFATDRELRKKYFDDLLREYYESLGAILHEASLEAPYTFQELKEEYTRMKNFGFIFGQMALVLFLKGYVEEPVDFTKVTGKEDEERGQQERMKTIKLIKGHPMFRSRYLPMIDDCMQSGVFDLSHQQK